MQSLIRTDNGNYYHPDDPGEITYGSKSKRLSVTDEEAGILSELAVGLMVLEIGTGLAVSTRALAKTAYQVVTIDIDPWIVDPKIANVSFYRIRAPVVLQGSFDACFIDGSHKKQAVIDDIEYCRKIPLLILHDTYLDEVKEAIEHCQLKEKKVYDTVCRLATYTHNPKHSGISTG